jgi:hypothetical protein
MVGLGLVLAVTRLAMAFGLVSLQGHGIAGFTAIAHVYMGILVCDWWHNRTKWLDHAYWLSKERLWPLAWWCIQPWQWHFFWFMNLVEVFSAIVSRS